MILEDKHYELFKDECKKWIDFFGLKDFVMHYKFIESKDPQNKYNPDVIDLAHCSVDMYSGLALIEFEKNWNNIDNVTDEAIKQMAFHEVCELLVNELFWIGTCRYAQHEELMVARHRLIRRMENSVYKTMTKMEDDLKVVKTIVKNELDGEQERIKIIGNKKNSILDDVVFKKVKKGDKL